ncbi:AraC family transcriptional regulator [Leptolyngbya sp. CCNP1308]|uniref:AraC family transcriptional regulator n=1 Tax=Leptolyngbya sp. CCNP1308 TaxID=3110255 RepID=UPI002B1F64F0|nr:AraC family transcriptional regulator [Leptolyngbya sp. CCNP1308]MEA5449533.1 AraC family transcriptional regulator [Leptolyngbya sp. CCNP1308]
MASTLLGASELIQRLNRTTVLSSQQMGWDGILVEQHQYSSPEKTEEKELPALSEHWLILPLGHPTYISQKSDYCLHESIFQQGDSLLVPAGQPSHWCCPRSEARQTELYIHLQPRLVKQVAEAAEVDTERLDLVNHFAKQDLQLQQIAMLLLAELRSDSMMGKLYVESLSQTLVIHLLRHYSGVVKIITPDNRSLAYKQVQQAIDYIHTYLEQDLSLTELASVINISPTYFASLFKQAIGTSPHQYVIQQRVERAKMMLKRTDLAIADIALQVGFSSQSHLTQHFKRLTGLTPKQIR